MATVEMLKPAIIGLEFRQEKDDPDYGSCMWARFFIDTENYDLQIMSDCGNYAYVWHPTPNAESFMRLLSRINDSYLLNKIGDRTVIDEKTTFSELKKLYFTSQINDDDYDEFLDDLEDACVADTAYELAGAVGRCLVRWDIDYDDGDIYYCINKDYPANAKKIVEVFMNYMQPKIKELLKEGGEE